jgi:S-adenosylmethionine:tRNA ribosyltransferase-isomerase
VNVDLFDFRLPAEQIAQRPASRRDGSRLMVLDRRGGEVTHARFDQLPSWLDPGDLLVFNDTRVIPARLIGVKPSGGRVELLLLERFPPGTEHRQDWSCLLRASRSPQIGATLTFSDGLRAVVIARDEQNWRVRLESEQDSIDDLIQRVGRMPLPPYISRPEPDTASGRDLAREDRERYQTIFARRPGAVAAPTAGLHFTPELLERLTAGGIHQTWVTLHVGPGTFQPVRVDRVEDHVMHEERYQVGEEAARLIRRTRERGGRVVAVGTTVARTLEHVAAQSGEVRPADAASGLFIYPGFEFHVIDALLTNFHLPKSTLLMLVSAFAGREPVLAAYEQAVSRGYRFYSYGDAMLIRSPR